jgi:serine/threonine protein phosphatase PrpC
MKFGVHQASKIGGRKYNQDRVGYAYSDESLLLVLADGMGGHLHGEVAAQIAVLTYMRSFAQVALPRIADPHVFLREVMLQAHHEILRFAKEQKLGGNPGTTCVAAVVQDGQVWCAHAGDSRFYLLRDNAVVEVTHDHSVVQQWLDLDIIKASELKTHPDRNKITNCLGGVEDMFYAESSMPVTMKSGDVVLLCSDGLWSPLQDTEMARAFTTSPLSRLEELIDLSIKREGLRADNSTALVARWGEDEAEHLTELPVAVVLDYR